MLLTTEVTNCLQCTMASANLRIFLSLFPSFYVVVGCDLSPKLQLLDYLGIVRQCLCLHKYSIITSKLHKKTTFTPLFVYTRNGIETFHYIIKLTQKNNFS